MGAPQADQVKRNGSHDHHKQFKGDGKKKAPAEWKKGSQGFKPHQHQKKDHHQGDSSHPPKGNQGKVAQGKPAGGKEGPSGADGEGGKKKKLAFADSDDEGEMELKINQKFAKEYEQRKKNQELSQLNSMYGSDEGEESSESEVEDEDGELVTPAVDAQILRTISLIKKKDPAVYDPKTNFFSEDEVKKAQEEWERKQKEKKAQPKPMYLKDYQRKVLLEDGGIVDEEAELPKKPLTYVEEQKLLKEALSKAEIDSDASDEEDFFSHRIKTKGELEEEEKDFKEFLLSEKEKEDEKKANDLEALKRYWTDPNLSQEEKFLRDYVLDRAWIEKNRSQIPNYDEILDSEEELEQTEEFERKYNFRHEEEGAAEMTTFSRDVPESLRRKDTKRAEKRKADKERKELEKEKKKEELKRLKNLKKKEILEKLKQVEKVSGASALGFENVDLEGDFDPEEHDRKMQELFNEDYYTKDDDIKNPEFLKDDISTYIGEKVEVDPEMYDGYAEEEEYGEDYGDGNDEGYDEEGYEDNGKIFMDADYLPGGDKYVPPEEGQGEEDASTKKGKKAKDVTKLEGKDAEIDQLLEEYYHLNYEDFAGGKPTRFKYRKVEPTSYGLTPVEILLADDKDLNQFISLKKLAPYRPNDVQQRDKGIYSRAKRVKAFRQNLLKKLEEENIVEEVMAAMEKVQKKGKGKDAKGKKDKKKDATLHKVQEKDSKVKKAKTKNRIWIEGLNMKPKKDKRDKKDKEQKTEKKDKKKGDHKEDQKKKTEGAPKNPVPASVSDARLKSYGLDPKRKKDKDHANPDRPSKKAKSKE